MNKFKLMLALLAAPAMVLTSCGDDTQQTEGSVKKVSVTCSTKTLGIGETVTAKANVSVEGGAKKTVKWSTDNSSVATVDANTGKITAKAVGSAKITATSTVDESKSGYVTITVVNKGSHPSLIDDGFEYVEDWPAAKIKRFAGIDTPTIDLSEGIYFLENPGDEEEGYAPSIEIRLENTVDNYYDLCDAFDLAGWHYHFDYEYYCDVYIDPTKTVEVDIGEEYLVLSDNWNNITIIKIPLNKRTIFTFFLKPLLTIFSKKYIFIFTFGAKYKSSNSSSKLNSFLPPLFTLFIFFLILFVVCFVNGRP